MLRTEKDFINAQKRLKEYENFFETQKTVLMEKGLSEEAAEFAMEPPRLLYNQLKYEMEQYEKIKRGDIETIRNLKGIGEMLIAIRLWRNISQKDLADRLGVSQAAVSKDEANEYAGVTVDKVQRILEALGVSVRTEVELPTNPGPDRPVRPEDEMASTLQPAI